MVSVPPRDAHQPPLVLVSTAGRPAMVAFGFGRCQLGKPCEVHSTSTSPGARVSTGKPLQTSAPSAGPPMHGSCNRLVLRSTTLPVKLDMSLLKLACRQVAG